jgi:indolepyruvate ferredoxin oxidoreductase alpha subunit
MILDNETTAMTGGQNSNARGKLEDICLGLGVDKEHIHVLNPIQKHHDENMKLIKKELEYEGVSVIIPRRECLQTVASRIRAEKNKVKPAIQ